MTNQAGRNPRHIRLVAALVLPFLVAGFVMLYLFPDRTEQLFAWTITPTMTPMLMGAGYMAGAYFFARALFAPRWYEVGKGLLMITSFTWPMLIATLLHLERFNFAHVSFWLWIVLYAVTPVLLPALYLINRKLDTGVPLAGEPLIPGPMRALLGVLGALQLAAGLWMFLLPASAMALWPWQLTPLTARVVGGWFILPGVAALLSAADPRWNASRHGLTGAVIWTALLLLAVWRARAEFDWASPLAWLYVGGVALAFVSLAALVAWMGSRGSALQAGRLRPAA